MSIFARTVDTLVKSRENRLNGRLNCIPWGFPRLEMYHPGLEQKKFYLITANSKVGKTQLTDHMFLYHPYEFLQEESTHFKLRVFYFSLEMSAEEKMNQAIARRLFLKTKGNLILDPKTMQSKYRHYVLPGEVLEMIKKEEEYFQRFEECVTFIDDIRNPFGIYDFIRSYANLNGTQHYKEIEMVDKTTGKREVKRVADYYEPHDPDEYVIIIVDHAGLLQAEKGGTLWDTIETMTSRYFLRMRDNWGYTPVLIQQQAAGQESVENAKMGRLHPTLDGLGINKNTQQHANTIFGLFSPFRHKLSKYEGYDVLRYRDHLRFLEILGGRDGGAGSIVPLLFHGGVNWFKEAAPLSNQTLVNQDYATVKHFLNQKETTVHE